MYKKLIIIQFLLILFSGVTFGQVKVRIFANQHVSSGIFTVTKGKYELDIYDGKSLPLPAGEPVILVMFSNRIAVKMKNSQSFMCDSLIVKGLTDDDRFSFRVNGNLQNQQFYSGNLQCHPDLGILVFINICDTDQYLAGVVRTEGGPGRNIEYLKSQTVLARTFMYKHLNRHSLDRYNLCDDTHCQAFHGISYDTLINKAVRETKDLVIIDKDSILIISAFHSNCGGETSISEDVWLSQHTYLKKVRDPYCINSPNATWRISIPYSDWEAYLKKSGFSVKNNDPPSYNYSQLTRQNDYRIAGFSIPFRQIRSDLNLRSAFFSVLKHGNSIILKGRGYGHGVGLCQEGAMVMSAKGFKFSDIIGFYYSSVTITEIKNAKIIRNDF